MIHIKNGKTYTVGEQEGKHFLDIDGKTQWFETHKEAFQAYLDAIEEEETE